MAGLELHAWYLPDRALARRDGRGKRFTGSEAALERSVLNYPDFIVFDLDPYLYSGKEAKGEEPELHRRAFQRTRDLALRVRDQLEKLELRTWVKTSGRTGLHLYLPIVRDLDFDAARAGGRDDRAARAPGVAQGGDGRVGGGAADGARSSSTSTRTSAGSRSPFPISPRRHAAGTVSMPLRGKRSSRSTPPTSPFAPCPTGWRREGDRVGGDSRRQAGPARAQLGDGERAMKTREAPLRYRPQPTWVPPMLATLADDPPPVGGWIYEPKLDGVRVLIFVSRGRVRLFSRNRKPLDAAYPELVEALSIAVRGDAVLDGEVVAIDPAAGSSSFALLQQRMQLRDAVRAARSRGGGRRSTSSTSCTTRGSISPACRWWTGRRSCATWSGTTIRSASRRSAPPDPPGCIATPAAAAPKGSSRSARSPGTSAPAPPSGSRSSASCSRSSWSAATPPPRARASTSARCWWAITRARRSATPARSAPVTTARRSRCCTTSSCRSTGAPRPLRRDRSRRAGPSSG